MKENELLVGQGHVMHALVLRGLPVVDPKEPEPRPWPPGPVSLVNVFQDHCSTGRPLEVSLQLAGYQNTPQVLQQLREEAALEFARDLARLNQESLEHLWGGTLVSRIFNKVGVDVPTNLRTASATAKETVDFFLSFSGRKLSEFSGERLQELLFTGVRRSLFRQEHPIDEIPVKIMPLPPAELLPPEPFEDKRDRGWDELKRALDLLYDEDVPPTLYYIKQVLEAVRNLHLVIRLSAGAFIRQVDELAGHGRKGLSTTGRQQKPSLEEELLDQAQKLDTPEGREAAIEFFSWAQRAAEHSIARARRLLEIGKDDKVGLTELIESDERWHGLFGKTIAFLENLSEN